MFFICQIEKHPSLLSIAYDIYCESTTQDTVESVRSVRVKSSFPQSPGFISGCRVAAGESTFVSSRVNIWAVTFAGWRSTRLTSKVYFLWEALWYVFAVSSYKGFFRTLDMGGWALGAKSLNKLMIAGDAERNGTSSHSRAYFHSHLQESQHVGISLALDSQIWCTKWIIIIIRCSIWYTAHVSGVLKKFLNFKPELLELNIQTELEFDGILS